MKDVRNKRIFLKPTTFAFNVLLLVFSIVLQIDRYRRRNECVDNVRWKHLPSAEVRRYDANTRYNWYARWRPMLSVRTEPHVGLGSRNSWPPASRVSAARLIEDLSVRRRELVSVAKTADRAMLLRKQRVQRQCQQQQPGCGSSNRQQR